jgi:hypothetical protein
MARAGHRHSAKRAQYAKTNFIKNPTGSAIKKQLPPLKLPDMHPE